MADALHQVWAALLAMNTAQTGLTCITERLATQGVSPEKIERQLSLHCAQQQRAICGATS